MTTMGSMGKKTLLGCYEIPGYGGANTATYKLFELMLGDGLDVCYLNIVDEQDADYFRYVFGKNFGNPKQLPGVHNCILDRPLFHPHPELSQLIRDLSPEILVGVDYIAALLLKQAAPQNSLIFLTAGCEQARSYIEMGKAKDSITLSHFLERSNGRPAVFHDREKEAVDLADLIVPNSEMSLLFYSRFFPSQRGKIHPAVVWFAEWIYKDAVSYSHLQRPFSERDIDLLFVASVWSRLEKNYPMVKKSIARCRDLIIHIVGEVEKPPAGVEYHGFIPVRKELFSLLGRAKTVCSTSLLDAAPGILFEASVMGCNIVASKNCGNWQICNESLLVDPLDLNTLLEKIRLSLRHKYEDHVEAFLTSASYKELTETITTF